MFFSPKTAAAPLLLLVSSWSHFFLPPFSAANPERPAPARDSLRGAFRWLAGRASLHMVLESHSHSMARKLCHSRNQSHRMVLERHRWLSSFLNELEKSIMSVLDL